MHRVDSETLCIKEVTLKEAADVVKHDQSGTVVNVRCRNFDYETIETNGLLEIESSKFLIFTRDPASFIISAAKYHLRGDEKWAVNRPLRALGRKTLTRALRAATSLDEQQIVIMKHFGKLYRKQVSLLKYMNNPRFLRIRCEDLFTTKEEAYFSNIASFLRCSDRPSFLNALKVASPAFKKSLPKHSTGAFKIKNPYHALGEKARDYFDTNWMEYARSLNYNYGYK